MLFFFILLIVGVSICCKYMISPHLTHIIAAKPELFFRVLCMHNPFFPLCPPSACSHPTFVKIRGAVHQHVVGRVVGQEGVLRGLVVDWSHDSFFHGEDACLLVVSFPPLGSTSPTAKSYCRETKQRELIVVSTIWFHK